MNKEERGGGEGRKIRRSGNINSVNRGGVDMYGFFWYLEILESYKFR